MKFRNYTYTISIVVILILSTTSYAQDWQFISTGIGNNTFFHVVADKLNPNRILASSERALYQTNDRGFNWEKIFSSNNETETINAVATHPLNPNIIYISTRKHLFASFNNGTTWQEISPVHDNEITLLSCLGVNPFNPDEIAAGTNQGAYLSIDKGKQWQPIKEIKDNEYITAINYHPNIVGLLLILTKKKLYKINTQTDSTQTVLSLHATTTEATLENNNHSKDNIIFFEAYDKTIALSANNTVYISTDLGFSWTSVLKNIGPSKNITSITSTADTPHIIIAYDNSIMLYNYITQTTHPYSQSIQASNIYDLSLHESINSTLFSATDRGIFATSVGVPHIENISSPIDITPQTMESLRTHFTNEPSIQSLQNKAIWYANVNRNKTQMWHRNARLRAFMPTVSLNFDQTTDDNIDIDRGSTSIQDVYMRGPQATEFNWQLQFEWDLANLMWNDDQTAIDYREKYMVEIREDILYEVTKLYFERRKWQLELVCNPPENKKAHLELCLKIDELTAHIDALTGGYLSECLEDNNQNNLLERR